MSTRHADLAAAPRARIARPSSRPGPAEGVDARAVGLVVRGLEAEVEAGAPPRCRGCARAWRSAMSRPSITQGPAMRKRPLARRRRRSRPDAAGLNGVTAATSSFTAWRLHVSRRVAALEAQRGPRSVSRRRTTPKRSPSTRTSGGPRPLVVVARHDEAVGADAHHGQEVAAADGRQRPVLGRGSRPVSQTGPDDVAERRSSASSPSGGRRVAARRARCGGSPRRGWAGSGRSCRRPRSRTACRPTTLL